MSELESSQKNPGQLDLVAPQIFNLTNLQWEAAAEDHRPLSECLEPVIDDPLEWLAAIKSIPADPDFMTQRNQPRTPKREIVSMELSAGISVKARIARIKR